MREPMDIHQRLIRLKSNLERVNRAWTHDDYDQLMGFFVDIFPQLIGGQRCSIFIADRDSEEVWLKFGTNLTEKQIKAPRTGSIVGKSISTGRVIIQNNLDTQEGYHSVTDRKTEFVTRDLICVPIKSLFDDTYIGAVEVLNKISGESFSQTDAKLLQRAVKYLSLAIESNSVSERISTISQQVEEDIEKSGEDLFGSNRVIAESDGMRKVIQITQQVGALPVNIFISGESGTGKEVIARMAHHMGDKRGRPFVAVNCSSIPEQLMESEFFGHEKGAFTGAMNSRQGRFEEAEGGTLFLDEIADMPASIQPKFLRILQEMEGARLGGNRVRKYNFRLISATSRDLRGEVEKGKFREDLFFRLFAVDIDIPPLRERRDDILPLALMFLRRTNEKFEKRVAGFSLETLQLFESYYWPGNVRQLQHEVERLVALTPNNETISPESCSQKLLPSMSKTNEPTFDTLSLPTQRKNLEIQLIKKALKRARGNKIKAAQMLEITRQSLHNKIRQYQLEMA
ncbi:MAG: sigma-54-dependent Fis family transcriptional regulator [Magnetococcales bacterium]|nr:sigma-54-dependent Fis family transcriptional regulator [Magnetococcales bacterium]